MFRKQREVVTRPIFARDWARLDLLRALGMALWQAGVARLKTGAVFRGQAYSCWSYYLRVCYLRCSSPGA